MSYNYYYNIDKPGKANPAAGGDIKDKIIFMLKKDVASFPVECDGTLRRFDPIAMKAGTHAITLEVTANTIKFEENAVGEVGSDNTQWEIVAEFEHPGSELEINDFITFWCSKDLYMGREYCSDPSKRRLSGTPCAPLQIQASSSEDKEKSTNKFTVKSVKPGPKSAFLTNDFPLSGSGHAVAADATEVDVANGSGTYQLADGSAAPAAITGFTNTTDGMVVTLKGSGGDYPSTISIGGDFILKGGNNWTALENTSITFDVVESGAGAFTYVEKSRITP